MKKIAFYLSIILFLSSCTGTKLSVNKDKEADFTKYKTFSFYGWKGFIDDVVEVDKKRLEKAFAKEFDSRNLKYTEFDGDIVVSLFLVVDKGSTTNRYNSYYGGGPYGFIQPSWGWGYGHGYPGGYGMAEAGVPYKENMFYTGTLVCDIFDKETKTMIWQGVISQAFKAQKNKKNLAEITVEKLMKNYPIKPQE